MKIFVVFLFTVRNGKIRELILVVEKLFFPCRRLEPTSYKNYFAEIIPCLPTRHVCALCVLVGRKK